VSLWIERAAAQARRRSLARQTQSVLDVAQASDDPADFAIVLRGDGGLLITHDSGWSLERLMVEHQARAAWRVQRDRQRVFILARAGSARYCLEARPHSLNPDPPHAGSAPLLPAASG
jgi:hypothetical protein